MLFASCNKLLIYFPLLADASVGNHHSIWAVSSHAMHHLRACRGCESLCVAARDQMNTNVTMYYLDSATWLDGASFHGCAHLAHHALERLIWNCSNLQELAITDTALADAGIASAHLNQSHSVKLPGCSSSKAVC